MSIYIDTCVLPRSKLETGRIYRERYGTSLGFELLMMFDLPDFEDNLKRNLELFAEGPLIFHEPVWGVDHAEPRGSVQWEEGLYHLRLTQKYAAILHPSAMVVHLSNGPVLSGMRDSMLRSALENLEEVREMFPGVRLLTENTGIRADRTQLLDQQEFTDLCRSRKLPVLIDVGHANANGWDVPKLIADLADRIGGFHLHNNDGMHDLHNRLGDGTVDFRKLVPFLVRNVPDAHLVVEYTRPEYHGVPLCEDLRLMQDLLAAGN